MATTLTAGDRAFVAAIVAAPKDGLPRLVYADWLDEHDRPWAAEFWRWAAEVELELWSLVSPGTGPYGYDIAWWPVGLFDDRYGRGDLPPSVYEILCPDLLGGDDYPAYYRSAQAAWLDLARAADAFTPTAARS